MKVGIFIPGANGDILVATSILKHKNIFWGDDVQIVWFSCKKFKYLLDNTDNVTFHDWDVSYHVPLMLEDFSMNIEKKNMFDCTSDLDCGYFLYPSWIPANIRNNFKHITDCTRYVIKSFTYDMIQKPYICFSDNDIQSANNFINMLPINRTNIMLETHCLSGQSTWNDDMTKNTIKICSELFKNCNFIFASDVNVEYEGNNNISIFSCKELRLKSVALVFNICDLFIGIGSGISVITCAWDLKKIPTIQFCDCCHLSTFSLSDVRMELIASNEKMRITRLEDKSVTRHKISNGVEEFYNRLEVLGNEIISKNPKL